MLHSVMLESEPLAAGSLERGIQRASDFLLRQQQPDGHWVGQLEADTTLESDTLKLFHLTGRADSDKQRRLIRTILAHQRSDGGWPIYEGGPSELNATVKAYVALKLSGHSPEEPPLAKAREVILRLGGLERINSFEKIYLALLGGYPWGQVPAIPPELVLLPRWFPFNLYEVAYWSRTILVPLAVLYATRPQLHRTPLSLEELWIHPQAKRAQITNFQEGGFFWRGFFLAADRLLKLYEAWRFKPLRGWSLRATDRWMRQHLAETDGLGAIFPAMLNAVLALRGLGYSDGHPLYEQSIRELERLQVPDGQGLKVQPCFSPVWDTALVMYVLGRSGESRVVPPLKRAADWLLAREVRICGDWAVKNPHGKPGGWAFEYRNPFYPDVDDTAQVLLGLEALEGSKRVRSVGAFERGLAWILSMQNRDGGWSSFDKNNNCTPLNHFPFADHNAMLDPSACDITGRVLELLGRVGFDRTHPAVAKGIRFLRQRQEPDGPWFGRWGVNYIYGTWLALRGLRAVGESMENIRYQQAGRWLIGRQNPDGGWGESCRSYDDPSTKGQGVSTPAQTAWALMTLMALGLVTGDSFRRGLEYLRTTQRPDGDWPEGPFTGTGFPRVFYLRYTLYRAYFPLLALLEARALWRRG